MQFVSNSTKDYIKKGFINRKVLLERDEIKICGTKISELLLENYATQDAQFSKVQTVVYYAISGYANWQVDDRSFSTAPGDTVLIKPNEVYSVSCENDSSCKFVEILLNSPQAGVEDTFYLEVLE